MLQKYCRAFKKAFDVQFRKAFKTSCWRLHHSQDWDYVKYCVYLCNEVFQLLAEVINELNVYNVYTQLKAIIIY